MDSLANYGSDDDNEESEGEPQTNTTELRAHSHTARNYRSKPGNEEDVNYDEVQMDLSDEDSSNDEEARRRSSPKNRDNSNNTRRNNKEKEASSRYERGREEDGRRYRRYDRREKEKDRKRSRSRSRERRRSRSGSGKHRDRSRERERERERSSATSRGYNKRYDRANNKMDRLDKMGIEIKTPDCQYIKPSELQKSMNDEKNTDQSAANNTNNSSQDRFFMAGITGRFREQIERRKQLWQKKEPEAQKVQPQMVSEGASGSRTTKVWEGTTFAQDADGKVASKFKRLMGIRNPGEGSNSASEVLKKQEEMFSSMEQQYEVARTATHTMRGVGLGFGSYQR